MTEERVLGKDYVILKGQGGRESTNGASVKGDDFMHLSVDTGRTTICRRGVENFLLTYADVDVTCPMCIEKVMKPPAEAQEQQRCPECGEERPGDDRVAAGMKCGQCAYGQAPQEGDHHA